MVRHGVVSSSVAAVGYSTTEELLEVEFLNGGVYQYLGVPPVEYQAFMSCASKGQYVVRFIKNRYVCAKLPGTQP